MRVALDLRDLNRKSGGVTATASVTSVNSATLQNNSSVINNATRPRTSPMNRPPLVDQERAAYPSLLLSGTKAAFPEDGKQDEIMHPKRKPPRILPINKATTRPLTASSIPSTTSNTPNFANDDNDIPSSNDLQQPSIISEGSISISSKKKSKLKPIKSIDSDRRPVSANSALATSSSEPALGNNNLPFQSTPLHRLPQGHGSVTFSDEVSCHDPDGLQIGFADRSFDSVPHASLLTINTNITPQIAAPAVQPIISPHSKAKTPVAKTPVANTSLKSNSTSQKHPTRRMSISFKPIVEEPLPPSSPSTPSAFTAAMRNDPELFELLSPMTKRHQQIKFFWDIWFKKHVKDLQNMNLSPTQIELLCQLENSLTKAKYQHFVEIEEAAIKQQEHSIPLNEELIQEMKEKITAAAMAAGVAVKAAAAANQRKASMSTASVKGNPSFSTKVSNPPPQYNPPPPYQPVQSYILPNIPPEAIAMVSDERIAKELDALHHYTPAYIHYIKNVASSALEILDTLIQEIGKEYPLLSDIKEVLLPMIFDDLKDSVKTDAGDNTIVTENSEQESSIKKAEEVERDSVTFVEKWYGMTTQLQEQLLHYQRLYHDHQALQFSHDNFMIQYDEMHRQMSDLKQAHKEALSELSKASDRCALQQEMITHQKETISTLQYNYTNVKQHEEYLTKESSSLGEQLQQALRQKSQVEQKLIEQVKAHEKISQDYFAMKARQQEIQQMNKNLHNEIKILKNDSAKAHEYYQNIINQLVDKFAGYVKTHGGFIPSLQSASVDYVGGQSSRGISLPANGLSSKVATGKDQGMDFDETEMQLVEDDGTVPIDQSFDDSDQVSGLPSIYTNSPAHGASAGGKLKKFASMFTAGSGKNANSNPTNTNSTMLNAIQQLTANSRPSSGARSTPGNSRPGSAVGLRSTLAVIPNSNASPSYGVSGKHISPNHRVVTLQVAGIEVQLNGPTPTVDAFMKSLQSAIPQKAFQLKYYEEYDMKYALINENIDTFYVGLCTSLTQCIHWRKQSDDLTISLHQQKLSFEEHLQQVKAEHAEATRKLENSFEEIRKELKQQIMKRDVDIVGYKQLIATKEFQIAEREDAYRVMSDHFDRYKAHTEAALELWRSRTRMLAADNWLGERIDRLEKQKQQLIVELDETNKVVQHQQETIQDLHVQMDEQRELHELAVKRMTNLHEQEKENINNQWTSKHQSMISQYDKQLHETNLKYEEVLQKYEEMLAAIPIVTEGECQTDNTFITPGEQEIQTDKSYLQTQLKRAASPSRQRRNRRKHSKRSKIEIDYVPRERKTNSGKNSRNASQKRSTSAKGSGGDGLLPEDGYAAVGEQGVELIDIPEEDYQPNASIDTGTITTDSYVSDEEEDTEGGDTFDEEYDDDEDGDYDNFSEEGSEMSSLDASDDPKRKPRRASRHAKRHGRRSSRGRNRSRGRPRQPRAAAPSTFYDETDYNPVALNPFSDPQAWEYFLNRFKLEKSKIQACKDSLIQMKSKVTKDLLTFSKLFTQLIAIVPKEIEENTEALQNINVYSMVSREITRRASMAGSSISLSTVNNLLPPNLILPMKHRPSMSATGTFVPPPLFRSPSKDAGKWHINDPTHPHYHNPFAHAAAAAVNAVNNVDTAATTTSNADASSPSSPSNEDTLSPLPQLQQGLSNMERVIQNMDTKEFLAITKQFSDQFANLAASNGKVATRTSYVLSGNQFKPFVEKINVTREVDPDGEVKMRRQSELRMYSNSKVFTVGTQTTPELFEAFIQKKAPQDSSQPIRQGRLRSPHHTQRSFTSQDSLITSHKPFSSQDRLSTASPFSYLYDSTEEVMEEDHAHMKAYWQARDVYDKPKIRGNKKRFDDEDYDSEEEWGEDRDSLLQESNSRVDQMTAQDLIYKYPAKVLSQPFLGYIRQHEKRYAREVALMQIALREYKTYHMQLLEDIQSLINNKIISQGQGKSPTPSPNSPPKLQKQASQRLVRQLTRKFSSGNFSGKARKLNTGKVPWKYSQILSFIQSSLQSHTWLFDPKLFIREMSKRQSYHYDSTLYSPQTSLVGGGSLAEGSGSVGGFGGIVGSWEGSGSVSHSAPIHDTVDVATQGKIINSYQQILSRYRHFLHGIDDYFNNTTAPTPPDTHRLEQQQRMILALQDTMKDLVEDLTRRMCMSGGWRSLLYGQNGVVDMDMDITSFPYPEQVAIVQEKLAYTQYINLQAQQQNRKAVYTLQQRILTLEKQNAHLRHVLHCHPPGHSVHALIGEEGDPERTGREISTSPIGSPSRRKSMMHSGGNGLALSDAALGIPADGNGGGGIFGDDPLLLVAQAWEDEESEEEEIFTADQSTVTEEHMFPEAAPVGNQANCVDLEPIRTLIQQIQGIVHRVCSQQLKVQHALALHVVSQPNNQPQTMSMAGTAGKGSMKAPLLFTNGAGVGGNSTTNTLAYVPIPTNPPSMVLSSSAPVPTPVTTSQSSTKYQPVLTASTGSHLRFTPSTTSTAANTSSKSTSTSAKRPWTPLTWRQHEKQVTPTVSEMMSQHVQGPDMSQCLQVQPAPITTVRAMGSVQDVYNMSDHNPTYDQVFSPDGGIGGPPALSTTTLIILRDLLSLEDLLIAYEHTPIYPPTLLSLPSSKPMMIDTVSGILGIGEAGLHEDTALLPTSTMLPGATTTVHHQSQSGMRVFEDEDDDVDSNMVSPAALRIYTNPHLQHLQQVPGEGSNPVSPLPHPHTTAHHTFPLSHPSTTTPKGVSFLSTGNGTAGHTGTMKPNEEGLPSRAGTYNRYAEQLTGQSTLTRASDSLYARIRQQHLLDHGPPSGTTTGNNHTMSVGDGMTGGGTGSVYQQSTVGAIEETRDIVHYAKTMQAQYLHHQERMIQCANTLCQLQTEHGVPLPIQPPGIPQPQEEGEPSLPSPGKVSAGNKKKGQNKGKGLPQKGSGKVNKAVAQSHYENPLFTSSVIRDSQQIVQPTLYTVDNRNTWQ